MKGKVGGLSDCDVDDPRVKELIDFALDGIQKFTNSPQQLKISRIIRAQTQVVSGKMLHLTLEVIPDIATDDPSNENASAERSEVIQCFSMRIWDQPWLNRRELLDLKVCESS